MSENRKVLYLFGYSEMTGTHLKRLLPILRAQINKGSQIGFVLVHDGVIGISNMFLISFFSLFEMPELD